MRNLKKHHYYTIAFLLLYNLSTYGQHSISGFIKTKEKNKVVYLSLLKYNEESAIYTNQILRTTKADSLGFFEFTGEILSNKNKLYRVHANLDGNTSGLEFYQKGKNKNHHNFIFSNTDTISFLKNSATNFIVSNNTNWADAQWRKLIKYNLSLNEEHAKTLNIEALTQTKQSRLNKLKTYSKDSITSPLVKLLAFSYLKEDIEFLKDDFNIAPSFYYNLHDELNEYYSGASYYAQYQDEIFKLSASLVNQRYLFHKRLNYVLGILLILLFSILIFLLYKLRKRRKQGVSNEMLTLTAQEENIVHLICEGMSNKDIASSLFISLSTVKSHIGNIYSKTGIVNRKQLIKKIKNHT